VVIPGVPSAQLFIVRRAYGRGVLPDGVVLRAIGRLGDRGAHTVTRATTEAVVAFNACMVAQ